MQGRTGDAVRLTFVTSSLEPGKDGVGDYARQLAGACSRLGHTCSLIALNDRHITLSQQYRQSIDGSTIELLRLTAGTRWSERARLAQQWLRSWRSDWVSLQFVAYGFHPKGIMGDVVPHLAPILEGLRLQLMLHELWIGAEQGASWRHRVTGMLQRRGILSLIQRTRPRVIHTSIDAYAGLLARQGVPARLLPLCGNIPVATDYDPHWLEGELLALGVPARQASNREHSWRFGIFGSLHPRWEYEPLLAQIEQAASTAGRHVIIAWIGRSHADNTLWREMRSRYAARFSFVALGERRSEEVSAFLQSMDFGVTLNSWQLVGKSGSAAAMVEHGLPVVVAGRDISYGTDSAIIPSSAFYRLGPDFSHWLSSSRRQEPAPRLPAMTSEFLSEIGCDPCLTLQKASSSA